MSASVDTDTAELAGPGATSFTNGPITIFGDSMSAQAGRNSAANGLTATGSTVNGGIGGVMFSTSFSVLSQQTSANVNIATNALALNALGALNSTAQVSNTQNALGGGC